MKGIVIRPGEPPVVVDSDWGLSDLQSTIGGWIESFPSPSGDVVVYGDEEGKLKGLPVNGVTDEWLSPYLGPGDFIVGTVVVLGFDDRTGDNDDVPQRIIDQLVEVTV